MLGNLNYFSYIAYMRNKRQQAAKTYKKSDLDNKLIGKVFNKIKILDYSHNEINRRYYKVLCLRCNETSNMRSDRFNLKTQKLNCCSKCRQNLAIESSKSRISPETVYNLLYCSYRSNAISRNLEFNLTKKDFKNIINKNCYYCNAEPVESASSKIYNNSNTVVKHNGIDRIDNNLGYYVDNCVSCCTTCNMMKKKLSVDDFINHIKLIYNNFCK